MVPGPMSAKQMIHSPIVSLLGPRDRIGWAVRYLLLAIGVVGTVFAHDVITDQDFHGQWADYLGSMAMIGLPLYAVATGIMADMGRLRKQLINTAVSDPMTGLLQRQAFISATSRRLSQTGVLLMLDIDALGEVNAKYDNHAGDLCLMALAIRLREVTRKTDIAGRVDGATIAVYLPGSTLDAGHAVAKRLSDGIQVTAGQVRFEVTVSVGLAVADGRMTLPQLLKDAESALLRAKARGRAQVMVADSQIAA